MNDTKFCIQCGAQIPSNAQICPVCGAQQPFINPQANPSQTQNVDQNQQNYQQPPMNPPKEKNIALILSVVSMFTGIHGLARFYTGHIGLGIVQLITIGGCGIWTIIDIVQIASGNFKDSDGRPLKE